MILITIDGYIYDVAGYEHPGEGICGCYLKYYKYKDVSREFFNKHITNDPDIILERARNNGSYENVFYVAPNFFKSRIPKCFYFRRDGNYDDLIENNRNCFFITPQNDKSKNGYYFHIISDQYSKVEINKCNNKWKVFWNSNLFLVDDIEEFMNKLTVQDMVKLIK